MTRTMLAHGFLLDNDLIGAHEASRRVIEYWQPGASLRCTPDGHWLLLLPTPVHTRLDTAPGWPIGSEAIGGMVALPHDVLLDLRELPEIEPHLDLGTIDEFDLSAVQVAPRPEDLLAPPTLGPPDLRAAASIAAPTRRSRVGFRSDPAATRHAGRIADRLWQIMLAVVAVAAIIAVVALTHVTGSGSSILWLGAVMGLSVGLTRNGHRRTANSPTARGPGPRSAAVRPGPQRGRGLFARAVLTSPFARYVGQRQLAYLRNLEQAFQRRDWERALREAVPLGGAGGIVSLSLPTGWQGPLSPSYAGRLGGRSLAVGGIKEAFTDIYRTAASHLEQAGDIEKAAYVLADLLDTPIDAAHLLERHGRHRLAAQLAEGRQLEAALVVRLWWRAGERQRALDIAQLRGAFATAIARLDGKEDLLALQLRTAWVQSRREAGDHLGALVAAWPDRRLRHAAVADIQTTMGLGGAPAAQALAYLLNLQSNTTASETALRLLASTDAALQPARARFLATFADVPAADPAHDRRLATVAARTMTRDPLTSDQRRQLDLLSKRADRLLVADLPTPVKPAKPLGGVPLTFTQLASGDVPVYDAVETGGRFLLAHGGHGARLVTATGRELVRWDIATHRIVAADNGTRALLITVADDIHEFHQLDLRTRQTTRWAALRASHILKSYDGDIVTIMDSDGLAFLRTSEHKPRVIWRELDAAHHVALIERTRDNLTALLRTPAGTHELWRWDTPTLMLRQRRTVTLGSIRTAAVVASGHLVTLGEDGVHVHPSGHTRRLIAPATAATALVCDGDMYAVIEPDAEAVTLTLRGGLSPEPTAVARYPGHVTGMRHSAGRLVLWTSTGRVTALDLTSPGVVADFRTTIT